MKSSSVSCLFSKMKPCPQKGKGRRQGKKCLWFPPSLSSKNDVNGFCGILELLGLHIGKQESSLLAYVGHSERSVSIYLLVFNITRHQRHIEATLVGLV